MVKEILAYMGADGKLYTDKAEAERIDFVFAMNDDIAKFLKSAGIEDPDGHTKKLLLRWENWKGGDVLGTDKAAVARPAPSSPVIKEKKAADVSPALAPAPKVGPYKPKVAIVGVFPGNQSALEKEFGASLSLALYSPDDAKKLSGLRDYHKVFMLSKFTARRHVDAVRSVGQEPSFVSGGMRELKEALTRYVTTRAAVDRGCFE